MLLLFGIYLFHEKHSLIEYVGAAMIIIALVAISIQRGVPIHTKLDMQSISFYMSITLTIL
jgi:drug/metabolite transporter (DMT)-like permease